MRSWVTGSVCTAVYNALAIARLTNKIDHTMGWHYTRHGMSVGHMEVLTESLLHCSTMSINGIALTISGIQTHGDKGSIKCYGPDRTDV